MNKENPCRFEQLSTEELDNLLNAELGKEEKDKTTVIEILRILEEREADKPVELSEEVVMAWENYQDAQKRKSTTGRKHSLWITRVAAVFVAISILLFSVPAVTGVGFFETIAQWTADIFKFSGTPAKTEGPEDYVFETDNPDLQKVYDAVCEMGIKQPVVPMWIPVGYVLTRIETFENASRMLVAKFVCGANWIKIVIRDANEIPTDFTKDNSTVKMYVSNTINYYVVKNVEEIKGVWLQENVLVEITASANENDIHGIIKSVQE